MVRDNIPGKYHFYFNPKWVYNQSNTKRIAIRKIKVFPMSAIITAIISYNDLGNQHNVIRHAVIYSLTDGRSIFDLLDEFIKGVNEYISNDYPNTGCRMGYYCERGAITFNSTFPPLWHLHFILLVTIH
jgi:hypothetical protein